MKDLLEHITKIVVDHPKDVVVEENSYGDNISHYILKVNPEDTGKIIGREGKVIQAIRNVAKVLAIKEGKQIRIEIG